MRRFARTCITVVLFTVCSVFTHIAFGQDEERLPPAGQAIDREIAGGQAHRYRVDLRADEFFQARAEQKGADVTLRLLDSGGTVVAIMDSPNGKQGPETLSFVAAQTGTFILEVNATDAKAERGAYALRAEGPRVATAKDRRRGEVERLFTAGIIALGEAGRVRVGVKMLSEAEAGWAELGDDFMRKMTAQQVIFHEANAELQEVQNILREGQNLARRSRAAAPAARVKLAEALSRYRALSAKLGGRELAERVRGLGEASGATEHILQVLRSLSIQGVGLALDATAQTYYNEGEYQRQADHLKLAIAAYDDAIKFVAESDNPNIDKKRDVRPLKGVQAAALTNLAGSLVAHLGRYAEAVRYLNRALEQTRALYAETQDPGLKVQEAQTLQQLGLAHLNETKDRKEGIEYLAQAVEVYRTLPERRADVASTLALMASQYAADFDYAAALKNLDAALEIYREMDNKAGQMNALQFKAGMYYLLNDKPKVREALSQALAILQAPDFAESFKTWLGRRPAGFDVFDEFDDALAEYTRLDRIGFSYQLLEDYEKAVEYYEKALQAARARNFNPGGVRGELRSISFVYTKLERWDKAYEYAQKALEISRGGSVKEEAAADMADVGTALSESGRPREALKYLNESLALFQAAGVDGERGFSPLYSPLLNHLARTHAELGNRRMAIFYGKQGVNAIQGERRRLLSKFDIGTQRGFLEKNEKHYRRLADWLIEDGRLPEAEQVMRMLKEEEYIGFVRRSGSDPERLSQRAEPNPAEAAALRRYDEISRNIAALGEQYATLERKRNSLPEGQLLSPDEQKQLDELGRRLEEANDLFQVFLNRLEKEFSATPKGAGVRDRNSGLSADLRRWRDELGDRGVVFLYTLVGEDRYRVILTTPNAQTDGRAEVKAAELRMKVAAFRQAVQDPRIDPRPLGKELYDILVKPIERQLNDAKAVTLLWSLDDSLRYLPIAALWDGEQYFGQKYQNVVITLASRTRLEDKAKGDWRVLGLGVSEAKQVSFREADGTSRSINFPELPGAGNELRVIVRDESSTEAETGILPGRRLLDSAFTESALKENLGGRFKVVHIASHFAFRPGDLTKSFLLLGDGGTLSLSTIKTSPRLAFTGVELLTLSACDTAVGETDAEGVEIESFGVIAQDTGAKAVLATLWSVADESTPVFMSEFYRLRKENPQLTKAEALRLTQRAMIEGTLSVSDPRETPRGLKLGKQSGLNPGQPTFLFDRLKPYAHPYFWSPFILIGNWR